MRSHEYVLLDGFDRARIGRYLATLSSVVSAGVVFVVLKMFDVIARLGWSLTLTPSLMSLIGAAAVYLLLYALFNRFVWRLRPVRALLKVPDLQGEWRCEGVSLTEGPEGREERPWFATISIAQSWDRLRIRLTSDQSSSSSVVAGIRADDAGGYRLFYNYVNDPKIDQPAEMRHHMGFADMHVDADQGAATGEYFTGRGRSSFGRMNWSRS